MTPNCTSCNVTTCQTTMTTEVTWTWALVLVIIAPYVFTILRCLWQLCFKHQQVFDEITCVLVIFTFVSAISINEVKSHDSSAGVKSLFNIGDSTADDIVEGQTIDCTCQLYNPFILCAIVIVCDVLCYKSSKLACTINFPKCLCCSFLLWNISGIVTSKNRRRNDKYVDINGNINTESQECTREVVDLSADLHLTSLVRNENENERSDILCVCCATMWHEEDDEMLQLLKSLISLEEQQRKNKGNKDETFDFEAHIFFDDAFIENDDHTKSTERNLYVETLIKMVKKATKIERYEVEITPYGERLVYNLSTENQLVVHLKDKNKIRNKNAGVRYKVLKSINIATKLPRLRRINVMYMRYILEYKYKKSNSKFAAKDIYILALDGDVKFKPEDFLSLMRRLKNQRIQEQPVVGFILSDQVLNLNRSI
ncbi:CHS1 [Mytilus edulis]|uniref:CHS1 n=1 Tax=Mytilus edulis TaxID=6550 RepID=A0A8S3TNQ3_MYTED|nr:CHS1 [Mytilus edulis]